MTLSSALQTAQRSLSNTSLQTATVSRNVANSESTDYARRRTHLETIADSGAQVATTARAQNAVIMAQNISSIASESGQKTVLDGLQQLKNIFGGNDYKLSPAVLAGTMRDSMSAYATQPSDASLAQTTVSDAVDVANSLQNATQTVQTVRSKMDQEISLKVDDLNALLVRYETANTAIRKGSGLGEDVNDYLDERDKLIKEITAIVEVQTVTRTNNDVALYTADGTTLFEKVPRPVEFVRSSSFGPASTGNAVYIDGVPLEAGQGANSSAGGSLQGMLQIRDDLAPKLQNQLDEIARGLITTFAEKDQSGGGNPDLPGLFTWSGGTIPASGTIQTGIAATIEVNPALLTSAGGDPTLLRDGGINGANYVYNTSNAASYSTRLDNLVTSMSEPMAFDGNALIGTSKGIIDYAADSLGWLELTRSDASSSYETKSSLNFRIMEALSNETGVNIDDEMSLLLTLEQSYKAASRIMTIVDELMSTLMNIVR